VSVSHPCHVTAGEAALRWLVAEKDTTAAAKLRARPSAYLYPVDQKSSQRPMHQSIRAGLGLQRLKTDPSRSRGGELLLQGTSDHLDSRPTQQINACGHARLTRRHPLHGANPAPRDGHLDTAYTRGKNTHSQPRSSAWTRNIHEMIK
jgi:hypothetical protein